MSDYELKDKVAVVTGGAGGIGTHISLEFARGGATVVVASRKQERLDEVVTRIEGEGGRALAVATDITVPEQVDELVVRTVSAFGRLDVMVNNAGGGSRMRQPEETPYEEWLRLIDFNLTGTFLCCIAAGKQMIAQESGNIVNISSTAGTKGNPFMLHYSAAKAGMISLTNNLAFMWAKHNINVNCIAPGLIATDAMKGHGAIPADTRDDGSPVPHLELPPGPEDVAKMTRFLASDAARAITGEIIPVRAWFRSDRFWQ
ncbi:MAG: SDR family oxidoreductase [Gammaproteobacteria bacterium]|nr:SDR family oxidoreductase [Gammaproteobacteria bacterium]